jgi:hypothetical protein
LSNITFCGIFTFMNKGALDILRLADNAGSDVFQDRYLSDQEGAVTELQERYYPDAWMFAVTDGGRPIYSEKVVCSTPGELALARALRPDGINAEFELKQDI